MSELVLYTKDRCPFCKKAKEYYEKEGIEYKEINTSNDEEARQYAKEEYGAEKVPVIVKDGELEQIGFAGGG